MVGNNEVFYWIEGHSDFKDGLNNRFPQLKCECEIIEKNYVHLNSF